MQNLGGQKKEYYGIFRTGLLQIKGSGALFSEVPKTLRARKAIRRTPSCIFCKAGLFMCFRGSKK